MPDIIMYAMLFILVVWPVLTYVGDAVRYVWWRLKEVTKR